jgi:hypothetical protein
MAKTIGGDGTRKYGVNSPSLRAPQTEAPQARMNRNGAEPACSHYNPSVLALVPYERQTRPTGSEEGKYMTDRAERIDSEMQVPPLSKRIIYVAARGDGDPFGKEGRYLITYVFGTPGKIQFFDGHVDLNAFHSTGESRLRWEDPRELFFTAAGETYRFDMKLTLNGNKQIAGCEFSVQAQNFRDASEKGYDQVMSILSAICFIYDVPIGLAGGEITEENTGSKRFDFYVMGYQKHFSLENRVTNYSPACIPILSAYREGLGTNNPFYRFLSFFKAIEGVINRRKVVKPTREEIQAYAFPEIIPNDSSSLPEHMVDEMLIYFSGRKFNYVIDKLRAFARNALAHIDPFQKVLIQDRYRDLVECESYLNTVQYVAKYMIKNEFSI